MPWPGRKPDTDTLLLWVREARDSDRFPEAIRYAEILTARVKAGAPEPSDEMWRDVVVGLGFMAPRRRNGFWRRLRILRRAQRGTMRVHDGRIRTVEDVPCRAYDPAADEAESEQARIDAWWDRARGILPPPGPQPQLRVRDWMRRAHDATDL